MSFVVDQVRRIDAQLDRLQLSNLPAAASQLSTFSSSSSSSSTSSTEHHSARPPARILALQAAIRGLSPSGGSDSHALLSPAQIQFLLSALSDRPEASAASIANGVEGRQRKDPYETELEWFLASKATTMVYGLALNSIISTTVNLADEIWYWDEVLSSRRYTALYSAQISPLRFWDWSTKVWEESKAKANDFDLRDAAEDAQKTLTRSWRQFYGLVRRVIRERRVQQGHLRMLSPITRVRNEVREKQKRLRKVRLRNANALGVLLGEGLANESVHGDGLASPRSPERQQKWKVSVARNVALMEAVLAKANDVGTPIEKFDSAVAELTEDDPLYAVEILTDTNNDNESIGDTVSVQPQAVAERLSRVLTLALPQYTDSSQALVRAHGKPPRIVRYWIPATAALLSSSTILRILVSRKAEVVQWIEDLGATIVDFGRNWVVTPMRQVIKTIRHDEGSEVSIMSKRSLEGDRESLERMVVDFAVEYPAYANETGGKLTEAEVADIRARVREGDLTPVLKAYEKDLSSPFWGTVKGNLTRALLIQVQKTKVDIEVAMGGIDALLKSQELVFGFVGLTPGLLVTYFAIQSLRSSLSSRRGSKAVRKQGKMLRQLRNIDRILVDSTPTPNDLELPYRDQGLLLCEVHVLREAAERAMPGEIYREFAEEAQELCDVRIGVEKQKRVAERMRWAYGRWLA